MVDQNSIGRRGIICISIIGVCIVVVIALQAATLHRLHSESNDNEVSMPSSSASIRLTIQDELRQRFPGVFENEAEIMKRARLWVNSTEAAANTNADALTKECVAKYCKIILAEFNTCCCKIETSFISTTTAIDMRGINRTLAQFEDQKQYFFTEDFTQLRNPSCDNCRCTASPLYASAVYVIDAALDQYGVGYFAVGTLCYSLSV